MTSGCILGNEVENSEDEKVILLKTVCLTDLGN
jgi:hypothetical protein